jgi:hypothetical protein
LTSLAVTGNISGGNISSAGNINGSNITGTHYGAGNNLSNIQGANVTGNVTSAITANFANFAGNITVASQPNITSIGTLTSLTVSGNVTGGNLVTTGTVTTANLNATGANVSLGFVSNVKMTGGTSGQFLQTDGSGTLSWATVSLGAASNISNGTSNVGIDTLNGNVAIKVNGTTNIAVFSTAGVNVSGVLNVTGNINGANLTGAHYGAGNNLSNIQGANVTGNVTSAVTANFANFAGNVTVAAQANITSVGTLTSLTVTGNTTSGNLVTGGVVSATGNVTGGNLTTAGTTTTVALAATGNVNLTGANVSLGAVANLKITGGTSGQYLQTNGSGTVTWATIAVGAATSIVDGTSAVFADGTNGNVITKVGGTNVLKVDSTNGLSVLLGGISMAGAANFGPVNEVFTTLTGATGVVVHSCFSTQIFSHSSIAANFTVNLTNLSLQTSYATVITLMLNQGATAYIPSALQIGGVAQTIRWQGTTAPTGNANKLDAVAFTILRTGASTYVVTGQLVSYG